MPSLGFNEAIVILLIDIVRYGIPVAVAVWIIVTLKRIHSGQTITRNRLNEIEHAIRQGRDRL